MVHELADSSAPPDQVREVDPTIEHVRPLECRDSHYRQPQLVPFPRSDCPADVDLPAVGQSRAHWRQLGRETDAPLDGADLARGPSVVNRARAQHGHGLSALWVYPAQPGPGVDNGAGATDSSEHVRGLNREGRLLCGLYGAPSHLPEHDGGDEQQYRRCGEYHGEEGDDELVVVLDEVDEPREPRKGDDQHETAPQR